jgi:hypothetical protein
MSTLQDVIDISRYKLNNYEPPAIWTTAELVFYANEARNIIARDGMIIEDSLTASVCQFSTVVDQSDYLLNPVIIYVRSLKLRNLEKLTLDVAPATPWATGDTLTGALSGATCTVVSYLTTTSYTIKQRTKAFTLGEIITNGSVAADQGVLYPQVVDYSTTTRLLDKRTKRQEDYKYAGWRLTTHAQPTEYLTDYTSGYVTLFARPDDIYVAEMSVIRYPITQFSATAMSSQDTELGLTWQNALVEGICFQAYQKRGDETYDANKSALHRAEFRKAIDRMKFTQALHESNGATASPHRGFI